MKPDNRPLDELDGMIKKLQNYEEPYEIGAWEKFQAYQKTKKRRVIPFWFYPGLAAGLVAVFGFIFIFNSNTPQNLPTPTPPLAVESTSPVAPVQESAVDSKSKNSITEVTGGESATSERLIPPSSTKPQEVKPIIAQEQAENSLVNNLVATAENKEERAEKTLELMESIGELIALNEEKSNEELLNSETIPEPQKKVLAENLKLELPPLDFENELIKNSNEKWNFNVLLTSSVAMVGEENRMNLGAGFISDYKLTDKLSLSGGIALNQFSANNFDGSNSRRYAMDSSPNPAHPGLGSSSSVFSTRNVNTYLLGVEIPLGVKLAISESFYANTGIAPVGFIREKTTVTQEFNVTNVEWTTGPSGQLQSNVSRTQFSSVDQQGFSTFDRMNVSAFYNLSFGYTSKIGQRNRLSFEPYLRLPLGGLNLENSMWSVSGLNLKFGF